MKLQIEKLRNEIASPTFRMLPKGYQLRIYDALEELYKIDLELSKIRRDKVSQALKTK